jgi:dUTP pyrophosphatase
MDQVVDIESPMPKLSDILATPVFTRFAYLRLYVDSSEPGLVELYKQHVKSHNDSLGLSFYPYMKCHALTGAFPNSGFDLFVPQTMVCKGVDPEGVLVNMAKLKVKGEMFTVDTNHRVPTAYYLMPRSSMSKTPLVLANHVGLIDMGYRGEIMAALRCLTPSYTIDAETRLLQLCHPEAVPIWVELVENESDLSSTERGSGGFGSTGLVGSI